MPGRGVQLRDEKFVPNIPELTILVEGIIKENGRTSISSVIRSLHSESGRDGIGKRSALVKLKEWKNGNPTGKVTIPHDPEKVRTGYAKLSSFWSKGNSYRLQSVGEFRPPLIFSSNIFLF